ncbi:MAG TPA: SRPBCC family protein [Bacillus sp. (in: firmicutes)]|uniref:SRPBCC family protein n=1 Tax=Bacillus litorisediminis TaxID=2922713 RepID=UPI001FAB4414|nr:SRPBCC family protein [Bacillus litorisediminis]HWO74952.1 SRPBCC family protein [Bacillus sp. (in: firmicutes)]
MEAEVKRTDGGFLARFERRFNHSIEKVWSWLTQPDKLAEWLAEAEVDHKEGGTFTLTFTKTEGNVLSGRVHKAEPPYVFEFVWDTDGPEPSLVHWELQTSGEDCLLVFTQNFHDPTHLPTMLAGWHVHLDMLASSLDGNEIDFPWNRWEELHIYYAEKIADTVI